VAMVAGIRSLTFLLLQISDGAWQATGRNATSTPPRQHAQPHRTAEGRVCGSTARDYPFSRRAAHTLAPARVRSQVCSVSRLEGRLLPLVVYERPLRGPRCRCGEALKRLGPRTAQLRARTRQRPPATWSCAAHRSMGGACPPPDGRAWGDGWPVSAIPKLVIRSGRGLGHRGFPPPQATLARARVGRGPAAAPHCRHDLSVRPAPPPTPHPFSPDGAVFGIGFDDPRATWVLRVVDLHSRRPEGRADRR